MGTTTVDLRPFQRRVYDTIMNGQSVILQAPTGAGKTRAALYPFLENLAHQSDKLPLTCRYAVPLRVLARQFHQEHEFIAMKIDKTMNTRLVEVFERFGKSPVSIQTGEQADDPQFEAALTFCTIDQLLASGLGVPYSIGGSRANLNVAAVLNSYLVLDEFHLFPLDKGQGARLTTLELLRIAQQLRSSRPLAPFVLMTATFSTDLLNELATLLDARIVSVLPEVDQHADPSELEALNAGRLRTFYQHNDQLRSQAVLDAHTDCSLVVCNTVRRSQHMYHALREQVQREGRSTCVLLLHSRFTNDHRRKLREHLESTLSKEAWEQQQQHDLIVVATQVVEVGLDISATRLHTEIAPANSLIQRAGRCARFDGQQGEVHIYPLAKGEKHLPYDDERCTATQQALAAYHGQHVGFEQEQDLVNLVHTEEDRQMLEHFKTKAGHHIRDRIFKGWSATDKKIGALRSELIRDVQQVSVIIHPDPNTEITERPWQWESFGMHPGSLAGAWKALKSAWEQHGNGEHFCYKPVAEDKADETGERLVTRYQWVPVKTANEVRFTSIVALHPAIATYDPPDQGGLGFLLRVGSKREEEEGKQEQTLEWPATLWQSKHRPTSKPEYNIFYEQESYTEHITGLLRAYHNTFLKQQLRYPARVLEEVLGLPQGMIDRALCLAIACHDIGKLGTGWQQWCIRWQKLLFERTGNPEYALKPDKQPLAHTDYDDLQKEMREWQKEVKPKRPHHACEGAALSACFIEETLRTDSPNGDATRTLARATIAAIARHHAASSQAYHDIVLAAGAREAIRAGLEVVREGQDWSYDLSDLDIRKEEGKIRKDQMTRPAADRDQESLLYFLLVRTLRLADQRSFDYKDE